MEDTENTDYKQIKMGGGSTNFKPWLFKKGVSGNPAGRPKGTSSLKDWARKYLQELTDEEKLEFMDGLPKDIVWRMGEGQPHQSTDTELRGVVKIEFAKDFDTKPDETKKPEL
jgi:hypothetical protein